MNPPIPNHYDPENAAALVQFAAASYLPAIALATAGQSDVSDPSDLSDTSDIIENATTDTRVVISTLPTPHSELPTDLVVAFRGTADIRNWLTDLDCKFTLEEGCKIHAGFAAALDSIFERLNAAVFTSGRQRQRIWLTGHSLGGALALLYAWRIMADGKNQPFAGLYTFGQPRIGNAAFRDSWPFQAGLNSCTFRVVDEEDVVPRLPWLLGSYRHAGHEVFYTAAPKPGEGGSLPVLDRPFWTRISGDIFGCVRELRQGMNLGLTQTQWSNNTSPFYHAAFIFPNAQTAVSLNGQATVNYWLRIIVQTTDTPAKLITLLDGPISTASPPVPAWFRFYSVAGNVVPQLYDAVSGHYYNLEIDTVAGTRTLSLGDTAY